MAPLESPLRRGVVVPANGLRGSWGLQNITKQPTPFSFQETFAAYAAPDTVPSSPFRAVLLADQGVRGQPDMPFDNPSTPVLDDNLLADISAGERVAKTWSLRQAGLFVVTMSTVLWGVIIFVVWQMAY